MARYSSTEAALSPGRRSIAVPSVAARTISWPDRRAASMTLAATDTARSSESPAWAVRRRSSTTAVARGRGCSSWRTTSSPVRAEERQWTWRRSSPATYSRRPRKLSRARGLDHLAVVDPRRLLLAARGSGDPVDARVDHDLDGAAHRQPAPGQAEGIRPQRLEGSHAEDAAAAGRQAVRGLALPTRAQRRQSHAGADRAGHGVAERQDGGGDPATVGHRQLDACALAHVEPGRSDRPPDPEGEGPEPRPSARRCRRGRRGRRPMRRAPASRTAGRRAPSPRRGPRWPSRHGSARGYLAVGTGTLARTSSTTPTRLTHARRRRRSG